MDISLIIQMVVAAFMATFIYTIIGAMPGADETATIAPVTLVLVLAGLHPAIVLAFFMAAIVACKLIDAVPVSLAGIPAGVMSTPLVEHAMILKKQGKAELSIGKIASGAIIGTLVSLPVSLLLAGALVPFATWLKDYGNIIFFFGAVALALMSKKRWISLVAIVPFALLIQGLRALYHGLGTVPEGTTVFISFFLGITIGPVILQLFELLDQEKRKNMPRYGLKTIYMAPSKQQVRFPNPFKILTKQEIGYTSITALIGSFAFLLSPVGLTIFLGELVSKKGKTEEEKASLALASMEGLAQATYISGTLIPLIALGIPLSPMAIGPANPLFNAPPVFTLEHNMHHILSQGDIVIATVIGVGISACISFYLTVRFAPQICRFVFGKIPHEALLGLFVSLVVLLAFMDGGFMNVMGVLLLGIVSGFLHRKGVNYGVLFMTLYAAPWFVQVLAGL